jgi:quinol monooxygenase YgiN
MHSLAFVIAALAAIAVPACGDDSPTDAPDAALPDAAPSPATWTARVRGTLAAADLDDARAYHDQFAMAGESAAAQAGDFAHHVVLGTTHLGTLEDQFVAIDQWIDLAGAHAVYDDPDFQAGLAPLFAAPPEVELFSRHPDWVSWGDNGSGRATGEPYWFVLVKGRLAHATIGENKAAHDVVAGDNEDAARTAGDVAHLPHLAVDDDRMFFNIDIWSNEQGMLATLADPAFQAQFSSLFDGPPEVFVYRSTDWYQWYVPR